MDWLIVEGYGRFILWNKSDAPLDPVDSNFGTSSYVLEVIPSKITDRYGYYHARIESRIGSEVLVYIGETYDIVSFLIYINGDLGGSSNGEIIACDTLEKLESMAKKSEIQLELLEIPENGAVDMVKRIDQIIGPHTRLENKPDYIRFNPDTEIFEILFNGDPKKQLEIFKALFSAGIDVIEFSVPKAVLL